MVVLNEGAAWTSGDDKQKGVNVQESRGFE